MGAIWNGTPTVFDRIYMSILFSMFLFFYPGLRGLEQYEELSTLSLACGAGLYAAAMTAIAMITFDNFRKKRLIAQSTDYTEQIGMTRIGAIPIIQGLKDSAVWLLLPLNIAMWAGIGFLPFVFGPTYLLECSLTSMECRLFP